MQSKRRVRLAAGSLGAEVGGRRWKSLSAARPGRESARVRASSGRSSCAAGLSRLLGTHFPSRPRPGRVLFTLRARWAQVPRELGARAAPVSGLPQRPSLTRSGSLPLLRWRRTMPSGHLDCSSPAAEGKKQFVSLFFPEGATLSNCHR